MRWITVTPTENIPAREGRTLRVGDVSVAVFNTGDKFLAIENRCPHNGGPLADGIIGGTVVTCPLHNWRVCLETGAVTKPCESGMPPVRSFSVKVHEGFVLLGLEELQPAA